MAATADTVLTWLDRFNKTSTTTIHSAALTSGNIAAQAGLRATMVAALEDLTLCLLKQETVIAETITNAISPPTDVNAVKGKKWQVRATDTNGNSVGFSIPGADLTLAAGVSQSIDLTAGDGLAAKNAIEAFALSNDGEAIVVTEIIYLDK